MVSTLDLVIIGFYILSIFIFLFIEAKRKTSVDEFLVSGRRVKSSLLIFSVISTNVGMATIVGTASAAYTTGISFPILAITGSLAGFIFFSWLAPKIKEFGDKYNAYTLGDFFEIRYSSTSRILVGSIIVINYFLWTALQFVGVAAITSVILGLDIRTSLLIISVLVLLHTALAGLRGDIIIDSISFWFMVVALFPLTFLSLERIGGLEGLITKLPRSYFNPFAFGGPALMVAAIIFSIPVLAISMEYWQRAYASESPSSARKVFFVSGFVNQIFIVLAALLGLSAYVFVPNFDKNAIIFKMMSDLLPPGLLGLGIAGMFAIAMDTVNSIILVGSSTIFRDLLLAFGKIKEPSLSILRRVTFLYGLGGLLIAFLIPDVLQLLILSVFTLLPLAPAVVGGFVWGKAHPTAAFWSILIGFTVTVILLPFMPLSAFVPGFLLSLILFSGISLVKAWGNNN